MYEWRRMLATQRDKHVYPFAPCDDPVGGSRVVCGWLVYECWDDGAPDGAK